MKNKSSLAPLILRGAVVWRRILMWVGLSSFIVGCAITEIQSLPHLSVNKDWRIVDQVLIVGPGIQMGFKPDNTAGRRSMQSNEFFISVGFIADGGAPYEIDPSEIFLEYQGEKHSPIVFLCNRETDRLYRPNPRIKDDKVISVTSEARCTFLMYEMRPPDTSDEFSLLVQGLSRDGRLISVPVIHFQQGSIELPGRMW